MKLEEAYTYFHDLKHEGDLAVDITKAHEAYRIIVKKYPFEANMLIYNYGSYIFSSNRKITVSDSLDLFVYLHSCNTHVVPLHIYNQICTIFSKQAAINCLDEKIWKEWYDRYTWMVYNYKKLISHGQFVKEGV